MIAVASLMVVGAALRLVSMGDSLFGDEISTFFVIHQHGFAETLDLVQGPHEATPPLHFLLVWLLTRLGESPEIMRIPSLIAGVAAIPLTYLLGMRTVGRGPALVGTALVTLSPGLIFYSTEARAYGLEVTLVLASSLALLAALRSSSFGRWALYAVLVALAMYTHYTAIFVLAGQSAWALIAFRDRRRQLVLSLVGAVVLFLPWLGSFIDDRSAPGALLTDAMAPFGWGQFVLGSVHWAFSYLSVEVEQVPGVPALVAILLGCAIGLIGSLPWPRSTPSRSFTGLIVMAAAAPLGIALYSLVGPSLFTPRNLLASWPAFGVLIGVIVCAARSWLRPVAIGLVIAGMAVGAVRSLMQENRRPDYRSVVEFIERFGEPGDVVVDRPFSASSYLQGLEVEMIRTREGGLRGARVLRFGAPTITELKKSDLPPGAQLLAPLPDPTRVAAEASRLSAGRIFLVLTSGVEPAELLRPNFPGGEEVGRFLDALPDGYRIVGFRIFDGVGNSAPAVYEIRLPSRR